MFSKSMEGTDGAVTLIERRERIDSEINAKDQAYSLQ